MGRVAIHLLTAAAVLWHTVAGCCAHHAHAAELASDACPERSAEEHGERGHACAHHHHGHHHKADEASTSAALEPEHGSHDRGSHKPGGCPGHDSDGCDGAKCAFAVAKPASVPVLDAGVGPLTLPPVAVTTVEALTTAALRDHVPAHFWPASLRAHLFLCVLRN